MKISSLVLAALGLALASSPALSFHWPYHAERQVGRTLTVVHTPVPRTGTRVVARRAKSVSVTLPSGVKAKTVRKVRRVVKVRRAAYRYSGVAGGCRDGGYVRQATPLGVRLLQREVCTDIVPTTRPRPAYWTSF